MPIDVEQILTNIKVLLKIEDEQQDPLLLMLIDMAIDNICGLTNRNKNQLTNLKHLIIEYTIQLYYVNNTPSNIASMSEGGVSISYNNSVNSNLISRINSYKLNKVVNRK